MKKQINPKNYPYRSSIAEDEHPICTFCSKDEEKSNNNKNNKKDEDDEKNKQINDSSGSDYDDDTNESHESDELDIDYEYSFEGESLDVQDASDIDVSFDGESAGFDFDYDGDFGFDFDRGDNDGSNGDGGASDGSDGNDSYGIHHITFKADCRFFAQEILEFLEKMKFKYIIAVKNYPTIINRVIRIKDIAYKPFVSQELINPGREGKNEIAVFHYWLKNWDIKRKFIVVRTPKEYIDPQLDMFGNEKYEYKILVTNINSAPKKLVIFYRKRGNAENYIKEQKYDLNIGKLITDSFRGKQANRAK